MILALGCVQAFAAPPERISQQAANEIGAVLQEKASWTPAQAKMESQLIHASKKHHGQTFAPGAPNLRLDVKFEADGRILVDINAQVTPELLAVIAKDGGTVVNHLPNFHAIRALVTPEQLETIAASTDVKTIRRATKFETRTGSVDSQGDTTHQAITARANYGVSGAGIKVGVLSDSVDFLFNSQSTGDLGTVTVLSGQSGVPATGEGTAMLEIVHDLAPNAQLYFATADGGEANFAQNILNLRSAGCDIIVDDVGYFDESPFQDGQIAQAVNTVTAGGALYFSAAGNSGNLDSGTSGTWEGDFVDGGAAASPITEAGRVHSFGATAYDTVGSGGSDLRADLFWSDPLGAASDDYDLFVLDSTGTTVVASSTSRQNGSQDPYESVSTLSPGERIVVVKFSGNDRFLHLDTGRGELTIATSGATAGHQNASNAFCVAATDASLAYPNPFTTASKVEFFSSDGPRHVFFNANGSAITPGDLSSTGGAIRQKPDITAADGVSTSLSGFTPFYGTSAAAPHAAAIAALVKSFNPALTTTQIRSILTGSALDNMAAGVDRDSGYGIVMALAALQATDGLSITPFNAPPVSGPVGGPFTGASSFVLTNNSSNAFNWVAVSTNTWLILSPTNGTLNGNSSVIVTASLTSAANTLGAGAYTSSILFSNTTSHVGQHRTFTLAIVASPQLSAYGNAALALNPVAYWRLNETNLPPPAAVASNSGALGSAATGFSLSGVTQGLAGIIGTSFGFSNASLNVSLFGSHVDVPYLPALNPSSAFTVEFWVNPNQLTTDLFSPLCSVDFTQNSGNSRLGWVFYQNTNNWQFRMGGTSGYVATCAGGSVQSNAWTHIVGVYDGANATLYVNGVNVNSLSAAGFSPNTTQPLRFGATTVPNRTYDGRVDEVAFYNSALSAATITSHYNTGRSSPPGYSALVLSSAPIGYWHLDDPAAAGGALPTATNFGSLGSTADAIYQPGSVPGVPGVPDIGLGSSNRACQINGTSYVLAPGINLNITGPLTISLWANAQPANGRTQSILDKGTGSFHLTMDGTGHPHFGDGTQSGGDIVGPVRIDDGQWHQLTAVYNGLFTETLFVDGQSVASTTSATTTVAGNTNNVWLGGDPDSGVYQFFNGVIDEVALYTNLLTLAQAQQLYGSATNAPPFKFSSLAAHGPATNESVTLTWGTVPGRNYEVQYRTDLVQGAWSNLVSVAATNSSISVTDTTTNSQRFYRLMLLP